MSESQKILDQFNKMYYGGAWFGNGLKEILDEVDSETAVKRPIETAHNILEITNHISIWVKAVNHQLIGTPLQVSDKENWQIINFDAEKYWSDSLNKLDERISELLNQLSRTSDEKLSETVNGEGYTFHFLLYGVLQHCVYHAGQIALLKKTM